MRFATLAVLTSTLLAGTAAANENIAGKKHGILRKLSTGDVDVKVTCTTGKLYYRVEYGSGGCGSPPIAGSSSFRVYAAEGQCHKFYDKYEKITTINATHFQVENYGSSYGSSVDPTCSGSSHGTTIRKAGECQNDRYYGYKTTFYSNKQFVTLKTYDDDTCTTESSTYRLADFSGPVDTCIDDMMASCTSDNKVIVKEWKSSSDNCRPSKVWKQYTFVENQCDLGTYKTSQTCTGESANGTTIKKSIFCEDIYSCTEMTDNDVDTCKCSQCGRYAEVIAALIALYVGISVGVCVICIVCPIAICFCTGACCFASTKKPATQVVFMAGAQPPGIQMQPQQAQMQPQVYQQGQVVQQGQVIMQVQGQPVYNNQKASF